MSDIVVTENLQKIFPGNVRAVDGISFTVHEGEVFGFLGPNGAGKSTTLSMLTTQLRPSGGRATVDGHDVVAEPEAVRRGIGIVFQESTADDELTGRENLELTAALYGVPRAEARIRMEDLLARMHLTEAADRPAKTYSGGMRRRLELAASLLHRPKILFLDEPTLGLDPQGRAGIWDYVRQIRNETHVTVFMTTHYLDEADQLCDRIAIIDNGHLVAVGSPTELKDRIGGDVLTVRPKATEPDLSLALGAIPGVFQVQRQDGGYRIKCRNGEAVVPTAVKSCFDAGVGVESVAVKKPSLDEVFLDLTGRAYREEEGVSALEHRSRQMNISRLRRRA